MIRKTRFRWLVLICVLSIAVGAVLDLRGYVVNVLAGLVGAAIGIWVSIEIIEMIIEERRVREWAQVRDSVFRALTIQLNEAVIQYLILLPSIGPFRDLLDEMGTISNRKSDLAAQMHIAVLQSDRQRSKQDYVMLYRTVKPRLDRIHDILMLHLMIPGQEVELVNRLQTLQISAADWAGTTVLDEQITIAVDLLREKSLSTLSVLSDVLSFLSKHS